jgi:hypothetical protein
MWSLYFVTHSGEVRRRILTNAVALSYRYYDYSARRLQARQHVSLIAYSSP